MAYNNDRREKMFREFLHKDIEYKERNKLKYFKNIQKEVCQKASLKPSDFHFLLWAYDLKFFTIRHAGKELSLSERAIGNNIIGPLSRKRYIFKYIDKLSPSQKYEDHLFREETKYNYRVRYAMTQRSRRIIEDFYERVGIM